MSATMPVSLPPNVLLQKLDALLVDGSLSAADAQALTGGQPLDESQRALVKSRLTTAHFPDAATRDAVLSTLGLSAADLSAPSATSGSSLTTKLKNKLTELAKDELYKPYDLKLTELTLGSRSGVDLRVKAQLVDTKDPLVAEDKHRLATTERAAAEGTPLTWAIAGGGVYPRTGFSASIPMGAASASFGFSADAALGYSVLAPYKHEAEAALDLAKNLTVELPFDASKAKALAEGTEVTLRGRGNIAANASLGVGYQLAQVGDLISVGATFGSSAGVSKALDLSLRLKRLDKGRVFVSVSKVDTTGTSASLGAHVGVDAKLKQSVPDLGGGLYQKGGELVAGAVDKQLEKWLSLDFRATHTTSKAESEVTNYVIDLNTTAGAAAYEDLLKLDFRKVDQLSAEGDLSVRQAKLSERTRTEGRELEGKFGPITLLRSVSSSTESHGQLSSSRGDITFDRATLADSYSGILSNLWEGKRSISRELVATQEAGAPQPTYYYHVRHRIEGDGNTSKADVRRFLEFADMVGALDGDTKALASQDKFLESFGDSHRTVDVYLTDGALKSVASAPADTLMRAYAAAYERLDRPWDTNYLFGNDKTWKTTPWLATDHPKHAKLMSLLEAGPQPSSSARGGAPNDPNDAAYRSITGRALRSDAAAYKASKALVKLVQETAQLPDASARIHHLAQRDKELGLDFWSALAALAQVAGAKEVLVDELSINDLDAKKDLVLKREGAIQDPRTEIMARLNATD
jgi:hypothetical protein